MQNKMNADNRTAISVPPWPSTVWMRSAYAKEKKMAALITRTAKRLSRNVWRGWMAGARCDSGRLSKPIWTASCGPRPPVGGIAASTCVRGVGSIGAALAGAVPDGTAESVADERDRERDLLRAPIRLRLAALARQLPAAADGLRLVPAASRRLRSG